MEGEGDSCPKQSKKLAIHSIACHKITIYVSAAACQFGKSCVFKCESQA